MRCERTGETTNRTRGEAALKVKLRAQKLTANLVDATMLLKASRRSAQWTRFHSGMSAAQMKTSRFTRNIECAPHNARTRGTFTSTDDFRYVASGLDVILANLCLSLVTLHECSSSVLITWNARTRIGQHFT